jgi:purine-nucleoside phosphorylase
MIVAAEYRSFQEAAHALQPRVALILGSGLGGVAERLEQVQELPFRCIPGLEAATVAGHRGSLLLGSWGGQAVLVFAGRLHYYEGHPWTRVVRPVQIAHELGAQRLVATNAAGGIRADVVPGSLLILTGHLDCTQPLWWRRADGPMIQPHAPPLVQTLQAALGRHGMTTTPGVYAQVTGPCYETPAEVRALGTCGADAVGMSTGREIQAGSALGMACAGLSCITNRAAGLTANPISHEEVLAVNRRLQETLGEVLSIFLALHQPAV